MIMGIHENVVAYLKTGGCSPSLSGFKILSRVMEICTDSPQLSLSELFDEYVRRENLPEGGSQAKVAMRAAKYCFSKAVASKEHTFEGFIRGFSSYVEGGRSCKRASGASF